VCFSNRSTVGATGQKQRIVPWEQVHQASMIITTFSSRQLRPLLELASDRYAERVGVTLPFHHRREARSQCTRAVDLVRPEADAKPLVILSDQVACLRA